MAGNAIDIGKRCQNIQQSLEVFRIGAGGTVAEFIFCFSDQRDMGGNHNELIRIDQGQVGSQPLQLIFSNKSTVATASKLFAQAGVFYVVQSHKVGIAMVERVVGRAKMTLIGFIGESCVWRVVVHVVIARQVPLRDLHQAHHDLVTVIDGEIVIGDISNGDAEVDSIRISNQGVDQVFS